MTTMREYLRLEKIKRLHQAKADLKTDFNIDVPEGTGFTRSDMFHFIRIGDKKYVHKESMRFILTNGDTYNVNQEISDNVVINQNPEIRKKTDDNVARMFQFFREDINKFPLYPEFLEESPHFFVFRYYAGDWENISRLTKEDSKFIRKHFVKTYKNTKETITPFYNQMSHKLVKNMKTGEIKMVDLKSLEFRPKTDLAIYMYNDAINDLYLLDRRFVTRSKLVAPFAMDYPSEAARIIKHYGW
ncbi:hypothetical protein ACJVC5_06555 [Peredibacter sp. HCB2-198]|uniref:hypothetical protein n=1 Tax=Peredibacter sp. HCB2-198 TaxID=3383025 RepID=UPI0038B444A3